MSELSDYEFKTTVTNMLRAVMEKEQMGKVSTEMDILKEEAKRNAKD